MRSLALALLPAAALAGEAEVLQVQVSDARDALRLDVTVAHADEGWDHYADAWRVVGPDGTVFGTRELLHPHVAEQPFTRSLGKVAVPGDVGEVMVEARDSIHGWGRGLAVQLP